MLKIYGSQIAPSSHIMRATFQLYNCGQKSKLGPCSRIGIVFFLRWWNIPRRQNTILRLGSVPDVTKFFEEY